MRGTQLSQLLVMLREEVGRSASVAVGVDDALGLKQKLRRQQELLYDEYDWPHLRERFPLSLVANSRNYDLPPGINFERIEDVTLYYNNLPRPMKRGIEEDDFLVFNSDIGIVSSPTLKWDVRWTGSSSQIEVWPIPAQSGDKIIFRGIRALQPLIADNDTADIDDHAIVLPVAAELLAKSDAKSATLLAAEGVKRIRTIRGRLRGAAQTYRMGMGSADTGGRFAVVVRTS